MHRLAAGAAGLDAPLERERELALIGAAVAAARSGRGCLVMLEGSAGIGKTRLLAAASDAAKHAGLGCLSTAGVEFERDVPFGVVLRLFRSIVAGADTASRRHLRGGPARLAGRMLAGDDTGAGVEVRVPEDRQALLRHSLYWLTVNLVTSGPMLLIVDDAQWADTPSLRWLADVAARVSELPLLLLVAVRTGEPSVAGELDDVSRSPHSVIMRPAPLSPDAVRTLATARLGRPVDGNQCSAWHSLTGGNPFYVQEFIGSLAAGGALPADRASGAPLTSRDIREAVLSRLARLSVNARSLARAAAVIAEQAERSQAFSVAGLSGVGGPRAAAELVAAEMLVDESSLRFVHPIVRAAIYDELSAADRARAHRLAAETFAADRTDDDVVAMHLLECEPEGDSWAIDTMLRAADQAIARGAPDRAAVYLARALEESPAVDLRRKVLLDLGAAEVSLVDAKCLERFTEAIALSQDPVEKVTAMLALGRAQRSLGNFEESAATLERARKELPHSDQELALQLEVETTSSVLLRGSPHNDLAGGLDARSAQRTGQTPADRAALANSAYRAAMIGKPASEVRELARLALDEGRMLAEDSVKAVSLFAALNALCFADALDEANGHLEAVIAAAAEQGVLASYAFGCAAWARVTFRLGRLGEAIAHAQSALETEGFEGHAFVAPMASAFLADALIERGELEGATSAIARCDLDSRAGESITYNVALDSRGRLRLAEGEFEQALEDFNACGEVQEAWGATNPALIPWRSSAALAMAHLGRTDDARALLAEDELRARAFGSPRATGIVLRSAGVVAGLAGESGIAQLTAAVEVLATSSSVLEHARALVDLGSALRRDGQRVAAREPLRLGLDRASRCDAVTLTEHAQSELAASGAQLRGRVLLSGADSLTPSELRVAQLAARGLTNRQITQKLFVAHKTVEMHLSRTYRKLDISSRNELQKALATSSRATAPEPAR
jgi:DNA-binding CsgD family transcriptional regulator